MATYARDNNLPVLHCLRGDAFVSSLCVALEYLIKLLMAFALSPPLACFSLMNKNYQRQFVTAFRYKGRANKKYPIQSLVDYSSTV